MENIKIILSKAPSFGDSVHKYALWWRKCSPFYAVWMSSRRYSHANYYRQFMAEQLSDNVKNGGGLFLCSAILLKLLLTTFSLALLFACNFPSPGRRSSEILEFLWGPKSTEQPPMGPQAPPEVQELHFSPESSLGSVSVLTTPAFIFRADSDVKWSTHLKWWWYLL